MASSINARTSDVAPIRTPHQADSEQLRPVASRLPRDQARISTACSQTHTAAHLWVNLNGIDPACPSSKAVHRQRQSRSTCNTCGEMAPVAEPSAPPQLSNTINLSSTLRRGTGRLNMPLFHTPQRVPMQQQHGSASPARATRAAAAVSGAAAAAEGSTAGPRPQLSSMASCPNLELALAAALGNQAQSGQDKADMAAGTGCALTRSGSKTTGEERACPSPLRPHAVIHTAKRAGGSSVHNYQHSRSASLATYSSSADKADRLDRRLDTGMVSGYLTARYVVGDPSMSFAVSVKSS